MYGEIQMPVALISVSDKTGLVEFAGGLARCGWGLLASGGTAAALRQAGLAVQEIAEYTRSPEILGGRVKTLHPAVHAGILARALPEDDADLLKITAQRIDLVVVNLYPFVQAISRPGATLAEAVENIDIGGVALIRAAAKNHARVAVVADPADYPAVLGEIEAGGEVSAPTRSRLAARAFRLTAAYDAAIAGYLGGQETPADPLADPGRPLELRLHPVQTLRYGENPHQGAALYGYQPGSGPLGGSVLQGKALSYNNLLDLDAAWRAALSFERPAVAIVKHLSPCGIACADSLAAAFPAALACDPVSAFGGVIASNRPCEAGFAAALGDLFVECIAAPGFSPQALEILSGRKNLRLVDMPGLALSPGFELRSVNGGVLAQSPDLGDPPGAEWRVVSARQPTEDELAALRFAWKACQHVKSNAIVFAQGEATVGIGGGQPNRVDCVRIAAARAGERARGAVMASDAFFPFPDSIEEAARAGVTAVVSPGGSLRDEQAIAAADAHGLAMIFTGVRHFRH
jgi:phosphoribosylaminoimidazolecarboxamide formyltransferase/IMP cyclohydrolase